MTGPIADLTYRNYDGVMLPPTMRWWVISKASIQLAMKRKGFWVWASLSSYWYMLLLAVYYFMDVLGRGGPPGATNQLMKQIVWKDQFLTGLSMAQFFFFVLALLFGIGVIANDNKANALLVYLGKPCSKLDYLFGKWMGIFLPMTAIVAVPTLIFYGYCFLSYKEYGFATQDPWIFLKVLALIPIPGIFHASLCLGISSLFREGRLAGATYAGIYFVGLFVTEAIKVVHEVNRHNPRVITQSLVNAFYCSVDGIQIAMAKLIMNSNGSAPFPGMRDRQIHAATPGFVLAIYFGLCFLGIFIAWRRVHAVEIVS